MLSLGKIAAGPGAAAYYTEQIALGEDGYYAGRREEPGVWMGAGAGRLGWRDQVEPELFGHLLDGAGLRRAPAGGAVAGIDLTFRAPKSVSVLWAIAPDDIATELRRAHDAAVVEAFGYLERHACMARRGAGGAVQVPNGGFVAAAFMHRASRAGDPLLHTHVVVGNLTQGPDGRWTALDARHLYRHAKTAGYLYQAVLRREVTERLGLEWQPVEHGVTDIRGVDRKVIEHFSVRRAEIVEHLAEHGGRSARAAQIAALETRRGKDEPPLARQRAEWRARAAEHGLTCDRVLDLFGRLALSDRELHGIDVEELTVQASTFGRPEVLQQTRERIERLQQERDDTPLWRRADRRRLTEAIDVNRDWPPDGEERHEHAAAALELAREQRDSWLAEHGPDAERYLQLTTERTRRDHIEELAAQRLERVDRPAPALPDPRELPTHDLDLGIDLGP